MSSLPAFILKVTTLLTSCPPLPSSDLTAVLTRSESPRLKVSSRAGVSAAFAVSTTCPASGLENRYWWACSWGWDLKK